jgi:hypothetical protein
MRTKFASQWKKEVERKTSIDEIPHGIVLRGSNLIGNSLPSKSRHCRSEGHFPMLKISSGNCGRIRRHRMVGYMKDW